MAPLDHTLALLAMAMATVAIEKFPLDMANTSFDDQYLGCGPAMTAALPVLIRSEFQKNPLLAQAWEKAKDAWQRRGSPVSPLSSPEQAIAIMAYTMLDAYKDFNNAVHVAGRSSQDYRDKFHFKTFHFLLTQALVTLRNTQGPHCQDVFRGGRRYTLTAQSGDTVRFGRFTSTSLRKNTAECFGTDMILQVHTCHGVEIHQFSMYPEEEEVLIPPFEIFKVTNVTINGESHRIHLQSNGTSSNYNCEWLKGGSLPRNSPHLGGLLLATVAMAVVTGTL
ncbi:erythroblast NAD(P)(+)--arginine ADP-ribosyltransferase-like isoform X2 [Sylvia atricapilla]|uniref:erythroblast NAD(P)(+)--arginine ADP-ribosyltransferase-like isoform X2 n=1 Tax=Sylvia atricapilla TaxID=48155 RepID=UPI00339A9DA5